MIDLFISEDTLCFYKMLLKRCLCYRCLHISNQLCRGYSRMRFSLSLLVILVLISGCAQVETVSRFVKYNVQGEHYLLSKDYDRGYEIFSEAVKLTPEDAQSHYYLGRYQLVLKKKKNALKHLKKAVALDPDDTDFNFWLGVAYGENGHPKSERKSYEKTLALEKDHLQARIYLGHSQLKSKQYTTALASYEKVLRIWPQSPSSLYNRALIFNILGRTPEEKLAWLEYLNLYPAGSLARKATNHLNRLSDFSYRNHSLAARTVTLAKIRFEPFTAKLSESSHLSLDVVGATVSNMPKGTLQIIAYQKNNKALAREKVLSVKKYMKKYFPELDKRKRIQVSWFDVPEKYAVGKKKVRADEAIRFFLTDLNS